MREDRLRRPGRCRSPSGKVGPADRKPPALEREGNRLGDESLAPRRDTDPRDLLLARHARDAGDPGTADGYMQALRPADREGKRRMDVQARPEGSGEDLQHFPQAPAAGQHRQTPSITSRESAGSRTAAPVGVTTA